MTGLDRLLELEGLQWDSVYQITFSESEKKEYQSLKSQLESKLAELDKPLDFEWVKEFLTLHDDLRLNWSRMSPKDFEDKTEKKKQMIIHLTTIQSQHTNLVKALQDKLNKSQKIINERRNNKDTLIHIPFSETEIKELQNLLTKESK